VRVGLHSGTVTTVGVHEKTKRATFRGPEMRVAEAVANTPCGGQIVMSGETLASIASMQDLMAEVAKHCAEWVSCAPNSSRTAGAVWDEPAALSVASLGFHILDGAQTMPEPTSHEEKGGVSSLTSLDSQTKQSLVTTSDHAALAREPSEERGLQQGSDLADLEPRQISDSMSSNQQRETFFLNQAHELIEVVPWPLRERVR